MARFADLDVPRKSRVQWETREITMPRDTTRQEAKVLLTATAHIAELSDSVTII